MTGIPCDICSLRNATQVLRTGVYCAKCYTYMMKRGKM